MVIYKITNLINGKIYVGQTNQSLKKRFQNHKSSNSMLGRDIREYGDENFKIETLETCKTLDELDRREILWIAKLNCKFPNGYNRTDGGHFPKKAKNIITGWIDLYPKAISEIADANLSKHEYRVFLKLLSKLDFDNYLTISQTEFAQELSIPQPHISKAIKGLCERDIIIEGPRIGLNKSYRLNPYIAHKGSERKQTIIDFEKLLAEKSDKSETDADNDKSE
ncbi:MAG: GIY-YIG nuclease family protein [Selenomonadaceae bacterium]|nr:GIY-YIG nuclease family protein [Selenomonadaceae bacterium]